MPLTDFTASTRIVSAEVDANFALCVLTDTARTISVKHTISAQNPLAFTHADWTNGAVPYVTSNNVTALAIGAANRILTSSGSAPQWSENITVGGTLAVTGVATFSDAVVTTSLRRATSDGADNSGIEIAGGGATATTRGGFGIFYGNEHASLPGSIQLFCGNITGATFEIQTAATARIKITHAGEMGFFGATPAAKPTGVAVSAAGIHAALVTLGLIGA